MSTLASYFPESDDPNYAAYERGYPRFRKNLEERYPQVCENCEARVQTRIRQAGYEAKADHLRRMMEISKNGRAAQKARNRNWRSILIIIGAGGYWASVAGQLAWDLTASLPTSDIVPSEQPNPSFRLLSSCLIDAMQDHRVQIGCSASLVPQAGFALTIGILSLWWNPRLRAKINDNRGRVVGLGQYYQAQLVVLVVRFVAWGVLKEPSSSGIEPSLLPVLHLSTSLFTILMTLFSRRLVRCEARAFMWHEATPNATSRSKEERQINVDTRTRPDWTKQISEKSTSSLQFPWEKLASPKSTPKHQPIYKTPPTEDDMMDWTPSLKQEIRPAFENSNNRSVIIGNSKFSTRVSGNKEPLPPAEQNMVKDLFYESSTRPGNATTAPRKDSSTRDIAFAPPRFYPPADVTATTGLESLFDHAFTIRSPEDEESDGLDLRRGDTSPILGNTTNSFVYHCLRSVLLISCLILWQTSQLGIFSLPGNYLEILSLGSASLIAGFSLLETLKQPIARWHGMDILVPFAELTSAVHLGGSLPQHGYESEYFDRYGKSLLIFMAVREALDIFLVYRTRSAAVQIPFSTSPLFNTSSEFGAERSQDDTSSPDLNRASSFSPSPPNKLLSSHPPSSSFPSVTAATYARSMSTLPSSQGNISQISLSLGPFQTNSSSWLTGSSLQPQNTFVSPIKPRTRQSSNRQLLRIDPADSDVSEDVSGGDDSDGDPLIMSARSSRSIRNIDYPPSNTSRPGLGTGLRGLSLDDSLASGFQVDRQTFANPNQRRYPSRHH